MTTTFHRKRAPSLGSRGRPWSLALIATVLCLAASSASAVTYTGFLKTPDANGLIAGDNYLSSAGGYRVDYEVSDNDDGSWHYRYSFHEEDGVTGVTPATSHIIIQLSSNITAEDIFNIGGDGEIDENFPRSYGPGFPGNASNPGLVNVIFGTKFNLGGDQEFVEFDSTRAPQWSDFYAKGGRSSFVYNASLGITVANPNDAWGIPVDGDGNELFKVLAPDTVTGQHMPEPATWILGAVGACALGAVAWRRRRANRSDVRRTESL